MKETLTLRLQEEQYRAMLTAYHFRETDLEQLRCLGANLQRIIEPVMYYAPWREAEREKERGTQAGEGTRLAVIVSLGAEADALQNEYIRKERLTESYMIECIGMELLKTAYELTAEKLWEAYGLWLSGFVFPGEGCPLEWTEDIFRLLAPEGIAYNQAYMLTPKKTVAFLTTLQKERQASYCHICDRCSNLRCPNRQPSHKIKPVGEKNAHRPDTASVNLNYGYQRIFGKP